MYEQQDAIPAIVMVQITVEAGQFSGNLKNLPVSQFTWYAKIYTRMIPKGTFYKKFHNVNVCCVTLDFGALLWQQKLFRIQDYDT